MPQDGCIISYVCGIGLTAVWIYPKEGMSGMAGIFIKHNMGTALGTLAITQTTQKPATSS